MKTINVETSLRPKRIAFIIGSNYPFDYVLNIIGLTSYIWGGDYSIIIPCNGEKIDEKFFKLLKEFNPDIINVKIHLTEELKNKILDLINPMEYHEVNQNINPSVLHSLENYPHTPIKYILTKSNVQEIINITTDSKNSILNTLIYSVTGILNSSSYKEFNKQNINIKEVKYSEKDPNFIRDVLEIISGEKIKNEPQDAFLKVPFSLTQTFLRKYDLDWKMKDWEDPAVIVIGDKIEDFCYFYGLSKLRARVFWLPPILLKDYKKKCLLKKNSKLSEFLAQYVLTIFGKLSLERYNSTILLTSYSNDKKSLTYFLKRIRKHILIKPTNYKFKIVTSLESVLTYVLKVFEINNFKNFDLIIDEKNRSVSKIETPSPKNFNASGGDIRWITELFIKDYLLPNRKCLNDSLFYSWNKPKAISKDDYRVTNTGLIYNSNSHLFRSDLDIENMLIKPYFYQMDSFEIFKTLFSNYGYTFSLSDKGVYFNEILNLFDSSEEFFNFFEDLGNQVLLENISNCKLKDGIFLASNKRKYYLLEEIERQLKLKKIEVKERIDLYISKNIFQRGLILKCERCRGTVWYNLRKISDTFNCERCEKNQKYVSNHTLNESEPKWYYKLNEVVFQGISNNMLVPILTLNYLRKKKKKSFIILGDCELTLGEDKFESDINCLLDGKIVIGECKSNNSIFKNQIKKYIKFAKELKVDKVVFATMEQRWDKSTIKELRNQKTNLKKFGIGLEILTRKHLYAYLK